MTVSVVLICKNEAEVIADTIYAAQNVSDDIVALDSGSTDGTRELLQSLHVRVIAAPWQGFGPTKNLAMQSALHDWILQIDADERIDDTLAEWIRKAEPTGEKAIYSMRFRNYLGNTPLMHGEWGSDQHIRLFNRKQVKWNDAAVHEELVLPQGYVMVHPPGYIHHVTAASEAQLRKKMEYYAGLGAQKYLSNGKKFNWLRMIFSPLISFVVNYVFKLGFLDGRAGWVVARESARYTWLKYRMMKKGPSREAG
jgi:glycosyltransferase involved in cell wall biosynthesis